MKQFGNRVTKIFEVIREQKRIYGRVEMSKNNAKGDKIAGDGAGSAEDFHCFNGVQREPANCEEEDNYKNVQCDLDLSSSREIDARLRIACSMIKTRCFSEQFFVL